MWLTKYMYKNIHIIYLYITCIKYAAWEKDLITYYKINLKYYNIFFKNYHMTFMTLVSYPKNFVKGKKAKTNIYIYAHVYVNVYTYVCIQIHNRILLSNKEERNYIVCIKWMQLDNITIRDLSQIQKDKHYTFFFLWGL